MARAKIKEKNDHQHVTPQNFLEVKTLALSFTFVN